MRRAGAPDRGVVVRRVGREWSFGLGLRLRLMKSMSFAYESVRRTNTLQS